MENIIDNSSTTTNDGILTPKERNKLIVYIAICIAINLGVAYFAPTGQAEHLNGQAATEDEIRSSSIRAILFSFPIFGFIISTLFSLIPYKKLPYSKKYLRFSLVTILVIEIILLILSILKSL